MHSKTTLTFWALLLMLPALCSCNSIINPSAQIRHQSFANSEAAFAADRKAALEQAYFVIVGDVTVETGARGMQLSFTHKGGDKGGVGQGMAIGLSPDGYLLTAGHCVSAQTNMKIWVAGRFGGRIDCRPARLVFLNDFESPADVAVLKVEGKLDHYASFGNRPQPGDRVFAVVCNRDGMRFGGKREFAGGTVLGVRRGPAGSSVALVDTDVPQRPGDSGGPLLSSTGQLIGVFTLIHYGWPTLIWKRWTTCVLPNDELIQSVIAADRASAKGAHPAAAGSGAIGPLRRVRRSCHAMPEPRCRPHCAYDNVIGA